MSPRPRSSRSLSAKFATLAAAGVLVGVGAHYRAASAGPSSGPASNVVPDPELPTNCTDADGDGYGIGCALGNDCNDHDSSIHPGQPETCNFRDDDCNGLVDDSPACAQPTLDPSRVKVPAGTFSMGSAAGARDEQPVHRVEGGAFELDRHEATNVRYAACVDANKCSPPALLSSAKREHYFRDPAFADYPVIFVSHSQATDYCAWAGGRLPTEAEWERAARGTDTPRTFPWGDTAPDCSTANLGGAGSCVGDTDVVGRRPAGASPYGAMDMAGNVWEWTRDWYDPGYYAHSPKQDPEGPDHGSLRVMRGGCWASGANSLRTTCRKAELPNTWAPNVGFRCAYEGGAS